MKIDYEFTVGVPVDQAWGRMLDLEKVAPCLPGAAIQEEIGDGEYAGTMKVEIGLITVGYKGTVMFEETAQRDHRAVLRATGRENRGQGTASATIVSTLHDEGDGSTRVSVETDMQITGRVAQFGRGIAQGVATEMLDEFAACLDREISGGTAAAAAEPVSERGADADATADGKAAPAARTAGGISSGEDPAVAAGGTVEGAIVVGSSPSEAAAGGQTGPAQQPTTQEIPCRELPEEPEPLDLGAAGEDATPKRLPPCARRHRGPAGASLALTQKALTYQLSTVAESANLSAVNRSKKPVAGSLALNASLTEVACLQRTFRSGPGRFPAPLRQPPALRLCWHLIPNT